MTKAVKSASLDLCYFPLYMVKCHDVKDHLTKKVESLHNMIVEAVALDNREHMSQMSIEYQDVVTRLVEEPTGRSSY